MKAIELKGKSVDELVKIELDLLKELFNLRMQNGSGQVSKSHLLRDAKKNVARVKTAITAQQGKK